MPLNLRVLSLVGLALLPAVVFADFDFVNPPDTAEQIRSYGYKVEEHYVTTEDGYVLKMFRIPSGRRQAVSNKPLLMIHGILCSSDCWTLSGPTHGLAFIMADSGYDVWIGNNRGNTYSRGHLTIPSDDPKFWDYGIHEMGIYDLPAMIDYITETTNEPTLSYLAHSQGTTIFLIMASMRPEYQEKVSVATFFAPVAYLNRSKGLISMLSAISSVLLWGGKTVNLNHFLHNSLLIRAGGELACTDQPLIGNWCKTIFSYIAGDDAMLSNITLFTQVTKYCPAGASLKQVEHFLQLTKNGGEFTMYDYGVIDNLAKYGSPLPPNYPLENIQVPMLLFYSDNDFIATPEEVVRLQKKLLNSRTIKVHYKDFNHVDFMWSMNASMLLFDIAINQMVSYR